MSIVATPCEKPASGVATIIPSGALKDFPNDPLVAQLRAESYMGQPLLDDSGSVIGILLALDTRPLPFWKQKMAESLLPIFAARASAELERRVAEEALRQEKELAQITLASLGEAVISTDSIGHVEFMNEVACQITGWRSDEAVGVPFTEICPLYLDEEASQPTDFVSGCMREKRTISPLDHIILGGRNGNLPVDLSVAPILKDGAEIRGAVVVLRDMSQTHEMARQMTWQATHDSLTELANRKEFERQLQELISHKHEKGGMSALLYLDLDNFKVVNDTCGHKAGDELLRQLSQMLHQRIRQSDALARLGGDEFGVLLHGCDIDQSLEIAGKMIATVRDFRFAWEDKFFDVGVSIGVVMLDEETESVAAALSAADMACYAAKDAGRNRSHLYQPNDVELTKRHGEMQWVSRIRQALEKNRLVLYVQTIQSINEAQENLHEILVRMLDENGKLVPPGSFIPAAERYGLMVEIDRWVIEHSFQALAKRDGGIRLVTINLSGLSFTRGDMVQYIADCQARYGVEASEVCFEVTETAAIANLTRAIGFMLDLRGLGFRFALDDFGSGLSSFTYLKNLPVDYLKIDGSFVADMSTDPIDREMVRAINGIGHTMGIRTIAEFVGDQTTYSLLQDMGVDYVQGFFISKPMPLYGRE